MNYKLARIMAFIVHNGYTITDPLRLFDSLMKNEKETYTLEYVAVEKNTVFFELNGIFGFISFVGAPYPFTQLDGTLKYAWHWPKVDEIIRNHEQQVLINLMTDLGGHTQLEKSILLSKLVASVLKEIDGMGVIWASSKAMNSKQSFIDQVEDIEEILPINLWVAFKFDKISDEESKIVSKGMELFDLMEIEMVENNENLMKTFEFVYSLADYLIRRGNIIKDGDIIDELYGKKVVAEYIDSTENKDCKVLKIKYL